MHLKATLLFILLIGTVMSSHSQEIITLPKNEIFGVTWANTEKEYYSEHWATQVVTNVSEPTLEVFRPDKENNTGTAVIIAPGGGLYAHSIANEGTEVAKWLVNKGITAFVLKYRLVPTGDDGVDEIEHLGKTDPAKIREQVWKVLPYSIEDGLNAIAHVKENAAKYDIDSKKIGFMGFSAGGAVTIGVSETYSEANRPDFLAPIYPWTSVIPINEPKADAPPMLIICASNDDLDLVKGSINLYDTWLNAGKSVGLHMYSKGGHGFGMRKNKLPSDTWIARFYEWLIAEGFTKSK